MEVSREQCVVGTKVVKVFDDDVYVGTVTEVFDDDQLWHVQYEDGDTERRLSTPDVYMYEIMS